MAHLAIQVFFALPNVYGELRVTSLDEIVAVGEMSEPLPLDRLIRVSLMASGVAKEDLEFRVLQMTELIESAPPLSGGIRDRGEALLIWMHEKVLTRYVEVQTRMDMVLEDGTYNCVSSAVLYLILARSQNIPINGVLTRDHAFCSIRANDDYIDIETTTPFGFDPGRRLEAVDAFTGRTGFRYVPRGNYNQRWDIGEKELISLIYQNRIAVLQRTQEWEEAVGLARDRWDLAQNESAELDFRSSIANYAAETNRQKRFREGLEFLNSAAAALGEYHDLEQTASSLLGNAVVHYVRGGNFDAAEEILNNAELTLLVSAEFIEDRRRDVAAKKMEVRIKSLPADQGIKLLEGALADGIIDEGRWEELSLYLWSAEARKRSKGGRWIDGWLFLQAASKRVRLIGRWKEMVETYRYNAVVDYHNRFITAIRRRKFSEAQNILSEALSYFPDAPLLVEDQAMLANID